MRVNVYAEEIIDRVEIATATAENTGSQFIGVRFYLDSPEGLQPPKHPDDDSSAVTFWVKSGKHHGYRPGDAEWLAGLFTQAAEILAGYEAGATEH